MVTLVTIQRSKTNVLQGLMCWAAFGVILICFIIMAVVSKGSTPLPPPDPPPSAYLRGEDLILYQGLGPIYTQPTSLKGRAVAQFQLGLQLLHLFWYDLAAQKFHQARVLDPSFVLAYWGEALSYKQPLWQAEDVAAAQQVLLDLSTSGATVNATAKDKLVISAVQDLFASNTTLWTRESTYAADMQQLLASYQGDPDICALAGLSLLGLVSSTSQTLSAAEANQTRAQAEMVLLNCSRQWPRHAGTLHYLVHLYDVDDLSIAVKGQAPSTSLAKIAYASPIAEHMESHIFMRFGKWPEVVTSNKDAVAASDAYCTAVRQGNECDAENRWHALEWWEYGLTQQCSFVSATQAFSRMQVVAANMSYSSSYSQWLYRMYSHLQLQSQQSLGPVGLLNPQDTNISALPPALYNTTESTSESHHFWPPHAEAHALFAKAYSLTWNQSADYVNQAAVQAALEAIALRVQEIVTVQQSHPSASPEMVQLLLTVQLELQALLSHTGCRLGGNAAACDAWRRLMDQALQLHSSFADSNSLPSLKIVPVPEFYGHMLVALNANATAAIRLFTTCLQQLPGRMGCVLGLGRAYAQAGDLALSRQWYAQVRQQCSTGDQSFPGLREASAAIG